MPDLISAPITGNPALAAQGLDAFPSSTSLVLGADLQSGIAEATRQYRDVGRDIAGVEGPITDPVSGVNITVPASRVLTPDEANAQYGIRVPDGRGRSLTFDQPVSEPIAQQLHQLKRDELARQDIQSRAQGGFLEDAARLGVGVFTQLLDPLNVAASFIPVVPEARYALWLERAGSGLGRAAIRTGVGAAEGIAGQAVLEPFRYGLAQSEQADYTATDSLLNIAFGGVLGGGLHAAFGAIGDGITGRYSKLVDDAPVETKEAALRAAVDAIQKDAPVRVDTIFPTIREAPVAGELDTLPVLNTDALRLTLAEKELKSRRADLVEQAINIPQGSQEAAETLARLSAIEARMGEAITADERRTLSQRRDELLTNTNPEQLQAQAAPLEQARQAAAAITSIEERLAAINSARQRIYADAALSGLPKFTNDITNAGRTIEPQDARALEQVHERLKQSAETTNTAGETETALNETMAQLENMKSAGLITDADLAEVNQADELIHAAEQRGKAAGVAAACLAGRV